MGKAITGLAEIGIAGGLVAGAFFTGGADLAVAFAEGSHLFATLAISGIAMEAGAIADALTSQRGQNITTRQPAGYRQIIYGEQRVGGNMVRNTTTGSHHDQNNNVIVLCGHTIDGIVAMYLDGRQVFFAQNSSGSNNGPGGYQFGGSADGNKHYDPGGYSYNFGSLVYCVAYYGYQTAAGGADASYHANDPTWATTSAGTPYGGGCAWVYLKYEYDSATFPSLPEIKFTVRGRNQIWDPRTGTTGYTTNWALCVADFLMDPGFGFGFQRSEINLQQLIAAANICDEQVPLAAGGSEPRYTFNGSWDTTTAPGEALKTMLTAAGGNIVVSGGQLYIYAAAAFAPSFAWTDADILDTIQWKPKRSADQLINRVRGIYTAPNYPYAPTGNLYDANGKDPDGYQQNNFNYAWQKTDYPQYAQDPEHGYPTDFFLAQDNGIQMVGQLSLPGTISVATAQRLAKIHLLLNRQQGTIQLKMHMWAWQMMPMDVFTLSYPLFGWAGKQFQVVDMGRVMERDDAGVPRMYVQVTAREYDPNAYAGLSGEEEQTPLDTPANPNSEIGPVPPGQVTLNSGAGYDVTNGDGILVPRVQVTWTDPLDARASLIEVQWSPTGANAWRSIGTTPVGAQLTYILGLAAGQVIDVRVRSIRGSGAASSFLEVSGYTVSASALSTIASTGMLPNVPYNTSNNATIDSAIGYGAYAQLRCYGPGGPGTNWTLYVGTKSYSVSPLQSSAYYGSSGLLVLINAIPANLTLSASCIYLTVNSLPAALADTTVVVGSYTCVSAPASGTNPPPGSGGSGGSSGGGGTNPACTVEGVMIDTPEGPASNTRLKLLHDLGMNPKVSGADGPESVVNAEWIWITHHQRLTVGGSVVDCSDTHTVRVDGKHLHCSRVPSGTMIDMRDGTKQVMQREIVHKNVRVLKLTLSGPSHEYSVGGVLTHNVYKTSN